MAWIAEFLRGRQSPPVGKKLHTGSFCLAVEGELLAGRYFLPRVQNPVSAVLPRLVSASGLNNRKWIVGGLQLANGQTSAVLLVDGATIPLDLFAAKSGWSYVLARRVNDAGQIIAEAIETATGRRGTFLLSPLQVTDNR